MSDNDLRKPEEILKELYTNLQSDDDIIVLQALASLRSLKFSSEAVRRQLEKLSLKSGSEDIRNNSLAALDLPAQRNVLNHLNKISRGERTVILQEVSSWEKSGLLENQNAEVIRRRYDFDMTPHPTGKHAAAQAAVSQPETNVPETRAAIPAAGSAPSPQAESEEPRPTLLQTLLSEAGIKIYLYLGAFFVIASAAIIGAAIPELRLPILIIGTLIFGGLSIAIKKRLPQPGFALFIVFSFLLPITANAIEETLLQAFNLTTAFSAGYWVFVYFVMAVIWGGSTWLYESRLFSITAFISLTLGFMRIGDIFDAKAELYTLMTALAAITGLAGARLLKKWKDSNFALPLFLTAQLLQGIILISSISIFSANILDAANPPLWHLASFATWAFALGFYILSDFLFPFPFFPWFAAGALIPMPWFITAAFNIESLGSAIILFNWGVILSIASEISHRPGASTRSESRRKYSLPLLLASMPTFALAIVAGFTYNTTLGMIAAFGIALVYTGLHLLRRRWWLWTLALLSFIISYFAFFNLEIIQKLDVFIGYPVLGISILFLLPDLFLKKDLAANPAWRVPPRIYGVIFTLYTSIIVLTQSEANNAAICFGVYTLFFTAYAFAQRKAIFGYLPAAYLPLTIIFTLDYFNMDAWLPALTALAVFYFAFGIAIRSQAAWSLMLRNSALALGSILSLTALITLKETGGWYTLVVGLLFIAEMYLRRSGWFELGAPILFTIGASLILRDLNFERTTYHLLAYSLVWILADLLAHLTFTHPRPLKMIVRIIGGLFAITSYGFLITEGDSPFAAAGFGIYTLLFLTVSLLYRQPNLFYAFTLTLPLFVTFLFRSFDFTKWIHPVIFIAMTYYAFGFMLRLFKRASGWDSTLLFSGLGLGVIVSTISPVLGGLDAAIPVAIAATLWAVEAFAKKNAWLAFPANGLYLLAYFILLLELNVNEPQFFSIGAALLGLIQHYLLVRAGSKSGAFIMGMISQFVLLGTTYIEMANKNELIYFFVLFFQSLAVLAYGLVIRSRSLTFFPIGFVVLGVMTVIYSALQGVGAIFVIGCTGIILLILGVFAVLLRERIAKLSEKISYWKA